MALATGKIFLFSLASLQSLKNGRAEFSAPAGLSKPSFFAGPIFS